MTHYRNGKVREYRVRDHMISHGWHLIAQTGGSRGPADLIMAHPFQGVALIQVGTGNKRLGPADRRRLLDAAHLCSALALVALVIPEPGKATRITYWHVIDAPPSTWQEFTP